MSVEIGKCIHFMNKKYALDLSVFDQTFLEKVLLSRMILTSCKTIENYFDLLTNMPEETTDFIQQLSNSYSEFFRNPLVFSILEQHIIPKIFDSNTKAGSGEIRIWSAGCASGQEPYSLAIIFDDFKVNRQQEMNYRIFATDSSESELGEAKKGVYDFRSIRNTRLELAEKYFRRVGDSFSIDSKIKSQVDFSCHDLLDLGSVAPPSSIYGDFDLIMCSNVLIYYQPEYRQVILQKFHRSLKKGGFFVTGEAEASIVSSTGMFRQYASPASIFIRNLS